jgi:RHS repeat-associated protein
LSYDHLGTVRLVTDQHAWVIARHDYLPFGEEIGANTAGRNSQWGPGNDAIAQKFTGQIRDTETGVDYFNARYFGAALGRFTSPDPGNAGTDLMNPQSWNGYGYVRGNPLNGVDPSGACDVLLAGVDMYPGKSAVVDQFAANKISVFPYAGSGRFSGIVQAGTDGGDVPGTLLAIRAAISQSLPSEQINLFTISGGAQTASLTLGQLSPDELARIGNITYMIAGDNPLGGALPTGNSSTSYITGGGNDHFVPSAHPPSGFDYNTYEATGCGHDAACLINANTQLLKNLSGSPCGTRAVITPSSIKVKTGGGGGGAASPTSAMDSTGWFGWNSFDFLNLLFGPPADPPQRFVRVE